MAVLEVVDEVPERHPGPDEDGRTAKDFRIAVDDLGMLTHRSASKRILPQEPVAAHHALATREKEPARLASEPRDCASTSSSRELRGRARERSLERRSLLRSAGVIQDW